MFWLSNHHPKQDVEIPPILWSSLRESQDAVLSSLLGTTAPSWVGLSSFPLRGTVSPTPTQAVEFGRQHGDLTHAQVKRSSRVGIGICVRTRNEVIGLWGISTLRTKPGVLSSPGSTLESPGSSPKGPVSTFRLQTSGSLILHFMSNFPKGKHKQASTC